MMYDSLLMMNDVQSDKIERFFFFEAFYYVSHFGFANLSRQKQSHTL